MTLATLSVLAAATPEHHGNIYLETLPFGIAALVTFCALALVTVSYRNVADRHGHKAAAYARKHANDVQPVGHGHGH